MYLTVINRLYFLAALFSLATLAKGAVVINEIHHDPDVKTELAEFIELYNAGVEPVDLSGWVIADAIAFTFPEGSKLDGGGFAVVAHNPRQFKAKFGISPLGPWLGKLDNDGERIELRDATGQLVDRVRFRLGFPWPIVGDPPGYSIELIHPDLDNNDGHNWRPSVRGDISTKANTLVAKGSVWKYFKGTKEASNPRTAWREADFTESGWLTGRTPIGYGENFMKTTLSDMRNGYTSVYFRKKFTVKDAKKIGALKLALQFDDGFNMWINGRHVAGNNMSTKEPRFSTNATSSAIEQHNFVEFNLPSPGGYLVEGENILAIQAHNASKGGSSDFFIDAELRATVGPTDRGPTPGA
ncbi:MAG: lamin tail domain-containing protein, partial [Verrucomicrobiota bacterium]|nr:lamin tail domain-containing protein [Verrucomicrobiota bacterium]